MPHAGLVTIILGVTVATVLYFMFGNNKQRNDQYYEHGYESYPEWVFLWIYNKNITI